nr:hypothetical protein HK105_006331 [Polyrhizophydium stewartii]
MIKMAHFTWYRKSCTAAQMADLLFEEASCLHGSPTEIVTDYGSQFALCFWERLNELLVMFVCCNGAIHPCPSLTSSFPACCNTHLCRTCHCCPITCCNLGTAICMHLLIGGTQIWRLTCPADFQSC